MKQVMSTDKEKRVFNDLQKSKNGNRVYTEVSVLDAQLL